MRYLECVFYTLTEQVQSHIYSPGHNQIWIYDDVTHICKMHGAHAEKHQKVTSRLFAAPRSVFLPYYFEGANGGTQFSVNYYFFGQISVNYYFLANSQLTTNFG